MSDKAKAAESANNKKLTKMVTTPTGLPELEAGWVYHDLRNSDGVYAGKRDDVTMFSFKAPMWAAIPVSREAQASVLEKYATPLRTPDGELTVDGPPGAVARMMVQNYETIRGNFAVAAGKGEEVTHAMIQKAVLDHQLFGGRRGGFKAVVASEAAVAEIMASGDQDRMMEYLRSIGTKVQK